MHCRIRVDVLALAQRGDAVPSDLNSAQVVIKRETFEEEVTLNILPHTRSEIVFSWKEIRQKGIVQVAGEGFEAQIPYEAVVGLTFDQQQIDSS